MPTNLPPDYFHVEERYREADSIEEKIACLEEMLSIIPKHKGTDRLRGDLRRKLASLKSAAQSKKGTGKQSSPYRIEREGAGQVVLIGPTNVGKSSLLAALTNAEPEVSPYPYTTRGPTPGMTTFEDVQIQLIDTPPLDGEFVNAEMLSLVRRVDLVLLVVDLQADPIEQLETSIAFLEERRIVPRQRQDAWEGERRVSFITLLVVVNKVDDERWDEDMAAFRELVGAEWEVIGVSAATGRNLDALRRAMFERLGVMRVYAKPPGKEPDMSRPFVLRAGSTVEEFAGKVHQDFLRQLKMARVWGSGAFDGQPVGRDYVLHDGDVVELRI